MSAHVWAIEAFKFATTTLPNLLQEFGEGNEAKAFAELAKRYEATRTAKMSDRTEQIAKGRAEVDAKLESRGKKG